MLLMDTATLAPSRGGIPTRLHDRDHFNTLSYCGLLYSSTDTSNDIGLIETETSIPFNARVGPACLPFSVDTRPCIGQSVHAVGKLIT